MRTGSLKKKLVILFQNKLTATQRRKRTRFPESSGYSKLRIEKKNTDRVLQGMVEPQQQKGFPKG